MEVLWAPWRMAYIERPRPQGGEEDCIFCAAARADADGMVAPKRHGGDLVGLTQAELAAVMDELQLATRVLEQQLECEGLNGGWNQGRVAGAGIDAHLHFHLVPRWNGDTNFMPILADVKVIPEHLEATAAKLRDAFRSARERG